MDKNIGNLSCRFRAVVPFQRRWQVGHSSVCHGSVMLDVDQANDAEQTLICNFVIWAVMPDSCDDE